MSRNVLIVGGAVLAALLVAVVVLLVVIIQQNNAAAEQDEHARIVAICEERIADPYGEDLDAMTSCVEDLSR